MNQSSLEVGRDVSEPALVGIEMAPSTVVRPPRVALAPAALECVYLDTYVCTTRDGRTHGYELVFGEVVAVYIADEAIREDGKVDTGRMQPAARLGYDEYSAVDRVFRMERPDRSMSSSSPERGVRPVAHSPGPGTSAGARGCHSSTRLPSGSVGPANGPLNPSLTVSSTAAPAARAWSSMASRSSTTKLTMYGWVLGAK